jgi:hypothetical protein
MAICMTDSLPAGGVAHVDDAGHLKASAAPRSVRSGSLRSDAETL